MTRGNRPNSTEWLYFKCPICGRDGLFVYSLSQDRAVAACKTCAYRYDNTIAAQNEWHKLMGLFPVPF